MTISKDISLTVFDHFLILAFGRFISGTLALNVPIPLFSYTTCQAHLQFGKDKSFLHQKYVVERLSIAEITAEIFSAESSVHKYLRKFGIPVREPSDNIRRKRALAYGRRIEDRREVAHQWELEVIDKMRSLRDQGFSYWKIADVLNAMKVLTKTRKGR